MRFRNQEVSSSPDAVAASLTDNDWMSSRAAGSRRLITHRVDVWDLVSFSRNSQRMNKRKKGETERGGGGG